MQISNEISALTAFKPALHIFRFDSLPLRRLTTIDSLASKPEEEMRRERKKNDATTISDFTIVYQQYKPLLLDLHQHYNLIFHFSRDTYNRT